MNAEGGQVDGADSQYGTKSNTSLNSLGRTRGANGVPLPLQRAFDIKSQARYQVLKNDMAFIYKTMNICPACYDSIKLMIVNQAQEEKRNRRLSGSRANSNDAS